MVCHAGWQLSWFYIVFGNKYLPCSQEVFIFGYCNDKHKWIILNLKT